MISTQIALKKFFDDKKIYRTQITTNKNLIEARLDPFDKEEVSQEDIDYTRKIQEEIFVEFENHVLKYRSSKIAQDHMEQVFSADVVLGARAKEIGLIDELGLFDVVIR